MTPSSRWRSSQMAKSCFFSNIIRFNSPSSRSHWCRCTFRTLFKKVTLGSAHDWNWWWSHISNNKLMRSISFIVNENLEKPLLTLLQPKASPRTNATEFLEIAYNGWRMVNAPEVRSVEWNTTLRTLWNQRKRDRFSVQFSKKEFDGWKEAERYKSFRKRIPADVIRFQEGRSTAEPVADDEKKKLKIDFRVQGIPQAAVEQEEKANTNNWKGQCFQSEITQAENWDVQAFHSRIDEGHSQSGERGAFRVVRNFIEDPVFLLCKIFGRRRRNDILWDLFDAYIVYETSWPRSEDVLTERSQAQWYRESQQAFGWTEDICRYLHQIEKDKLCIAPERWAGKSSSNFTEPSYSPKAVSRKAMEIEYLVSSFFFVGMERIAILVEFSKDGYQWIYISYNEFRLQDIVITPHRARFTRANIFSRVVQAYMLHLFVCFSQNNHLHERLSCFAFSWSRFFSSTLSSPISSSSLLDPSNMANVCAIPQVCLAVLPNRFRSHFLHRRQPSQWHRFSRQRLVRMSFARQIRFSWARNVFFSTARQEMPHFGYYDKVDIMVETRRLCRTNNLELTQSIEVYTEFVARKLGMWSQFQTLLKELFSKEGKHLFRPSNTTILEEVLAPLLNCHSEDRQFIVDSGASLQMTSKSATTIIKSKEFVVIMTTKGMSGSTDVFLSLWCWCKVHGRFYFWVSIIDEMLKKV